LFLVIVFYKLATLFNNFPIFGLIAEYVLDFPQFAEDGEISGALKNLIFLGVGERVVAISAPDFLLI